MLEKSDRRRGWPELAVQREGRTYLPEGLAHAYFYEETVEGLTLPAGPLRQLSFLCCEFVGGQWLAPELEAMDLSHSRFRHTYFEKVDFAQATLTGTRFEGCVFQDCRGLESMAELVGCLVREAAAPAPAVLETVAEANLPTKTPPADRFDRLERA